MDKLCKSTSKDLVEELTRINIGSRYDELIAKAKDNWYHDYKNPGQVVCGKVELINDLEKFPELAYIREAVMNGEYDEEADEDDKQMLRDNLPKALWEQFHL